MDNTKQLIIEFQSLVTSIFKNLKSAEELLGYGERKFSHLEDGSKEGTKEKIAKYKAKIETFVQCVYPYFNIEEYAESYKIFSYYKEDILSLYTECKNEYEGKEDLFVHDLYNENLEMNTEEDILQYIQLSYEQVNMNHKKWIKSLTLSFLLNQVNKSDVDYKNIILLFFVYCFFKGYKEAVSDGIADSDEIINEYASKIQTNINPTFFNTLLVSEQQNSIYPKIKKTKNDWVLLKYNKRYRHGDLIGIFIPLININMDMPISYMENAIYSCGILLHLKYPFQEPYKEDNIVARVTRIGNTFIINNMKGTLLYYQYQDSDSIYRNILQLGKDNTNQFFDFYLVNKNDCDIMHLEKALNEKDNNLKLLEKITFEEDRIRNEFANVIASLNDNLPQEKDIYKCWATGLILNEMKVCIKF